MSNCRAATRLRVLCLEGAEPQKRLVLLSIYMGHVAPSSTQYYLNLSQDLPRVAGRSLEQALESWLRRWVLAVRILDKLATSGIETP